LLSKGELLGVALFGLDGIAIVASFGLDDSVAVGGEKTRREVVDIAIGPHTSF
jgi:hypothetical protein